MGRRTLAPRAGMLFVYGEDATGGYWMKDTLIPLDIAFISKGYIAEIDTMQPCRTPTCPLTTPEVGYDWALEVNAGTFQRAGITAGAVVDTQPRLAPAD